MDESPSYPDLSGSTIGRYRLLAVVGKGGVATVYRAENFETGKFVAFKLLHPFLGADAKFRKRFTREAEVLSRLKHPNIVPILDFGSEDGQLFIVMPLMEFGTLADRLARGPLTTQEGARVIGHVSRALQHAHEAGVVHRDVKPSNILLTPDGAALLSDFGFVHVADSSMSLTGSGLVGTPAFMAPEQVMGEQVVPQSDQYALAVILYQISTGVLPYDADTPMGMAIKHAIEPLRRPREVNTNLPDAVEAVLIKALDKQPENRYASMSAFNGAFQEALLASIDPQSGQLRPGALSNVLITQELEKIEDQEEGRPWIAVDRRTWLLIAMLLLLLGCPGAYAAYRLLGQGQALFRGTTPVEIAAAVDTQQAVEAVVVTEVGADVTPGMIETAVAGTLSVLEQTGTAGVIISPTPVDALTSTEFPGGTAAVETVSPSPDITTTPVPTNTQSTLLPPTSTRTPGGFSGDGATDTPTKTSTATRTSSPTPSRTNSPVPTSTHTSVPPADTPPPTPTRTSTSPPTATLPPSATATQDICGQIRLGPYSRSGQEAYAQVYNGTDERIRVTRIYIEWPAANGDLKKVELQGSEIWNGEDGPPSANLTDLFGVRGIAARTGKTMTFFYENNVAPGSYLLRIDFDNGCQVEDAP